MSINREKEAFYFNLMNQNPGLKEYLLDASTAGEQIANITTFILILKYRLKIKFTISENNPYIKRMQKAEKDPLLSATLENNNEVMLNNLLNMAIYIHKIFIKEICQTSDIL